MEFSGVDTELEEEEMEITDMEPGGNVYIPILDMEGQEAPPHKSLISMIPTLHKIQV